MPFKTKLPMRQLQLTAMRKLLKYYKSDEEGLQSCPLCKVKNSYSNRELDCKECVWTAETGIECWEHPMLRYGPNRQTMSVGMCRTQKPKKWVTRRVRELTAWIKKYSEKV